MHQMVMKKLKCIMVISIAHNNCITTLLIHDISTLLIHNQLQPLTVNVRGFYYLLTKISLCNINTLLLYCKMLKCSYTE